MTEKTKILLSIGFRENTDNTTHTIDWYILFKLPRNDEWKVIKNELTNYQFLYLVFESCSNHLTGTMAYSVFSKTN